jgi:tetratricopeptide (TPR) repeat protein
MSEIAEKLSQHFSAARRTKRWAIVHRRAVLAGTLGLVLSSGASAAYLLGREPYAVRLYERGLLYYGRREFKDALECFNAAIAEDPQLADVYYRRGRTFVQLGDYAFALEDFARAAEHRNDGRIQACRGYCVNRSHTNLYGDAASKYETAINAGYQSVGLYNNLGYCYLRNRQFDKAREYLRLAISMGAETPQVFYNRACVELAAARWRDDGLTESLQEGIDCMAKAMQLAPDCGWIAIDAAAIFALASRHDPAYVEDCLSCLSEAVRLGIDLGESGFDDDPVFEHLRQDPRYPSIRRSQRANIEPKFLDHYLDPVQDLNEQPSG